MPGRRLSLYGAPRQSQTQEFCTNFGSGNCLNDWNGSHIQGAVIKMFTAHQSNETWEYQSIDPCNSTQVGQDADEVTSTCPFVVGSGLNGKYLGDQIFQLYYPAANKCLGTVTGTGSNTGQGILTGCNSPQGAGGGDGTILVTAPGNDDSIIDRYWTNQSPSTVTAYVCGTGFENPVTMSSSDHTNDCEWNAPPA